MFPVIETNRLKLRALISQDDAFIFSLRSHPDIFKYVDIEPYQDIQRARRFIAAVQKDIEEGEALFWGITIKDSNEMVGTICLWNFETHKWNGDGTWLKAELGYEVHPDYQGRGIAKEAIGGVLVYARSASPIKIIDAITHKDNAPSLRLLESYSFDALGVAKDIEPEIDEGPDMLLFRMDLRE